MQGYSTFPIVLRLKPHHQMQYSIYWNSGSLLSNTASLSRYLSNVQPIGLVWHKAFFRWVRAQGWSPGTSDDSKNASSPVAISHKRQTINQAPPRRVRAWGYSALRFEDAGQEAPRPTVSGGRTHRPDPYTDQHGRPRCVPARIH